MPTWAVLLFVGFGGVCLALTLPTIVIPKTQYAGDNDCS